MSTDASLPKISLADLVALNDEIAALARAGVPLDLGLSSFGRDVPGRLGKVTQTISQRMQQGESLPQILSSADSGIPATYAAVVSAGIRAGRLPSALEGVAHALRRGLQLRRSLTVSLIYPLVVLTLTLGLLVFWMTKIAPVLVASFSDWNTIASWYGPLSQTLFETSAIWGRVLLPVALLYVLFLWYRLGRAAKGPIRRRRFSPGFVGRFRRMRIAGEKGLLAEFLAVLLEHGTPLDEALRVAGQAVGYAPLRDGAEQLADRVRRGETPTTDIADFPPIVSCLLVATRPGQRVEALRRVARSYHDEALRHSQALATTVPLLFTVVVAGGCLAFYALVTLIPWLFMLHRIATVAGT